jgi:hypothetical protein
MNLISLSIKKGLWKFFSAAVVTLFSSVALAQGTSFKVTYMDYPGAIERYGEALQQAYAQLGISIEFVKLTDGLTLQDTNQGKFDGDLMRASGIEESFVQMMPVGNALETANIVLLCQQQLSCEPSVLSKNNIQVHSIKSAKLWNKAIEQYPVKTIYQENLAELKALFIAKKIDYMVYTLDSSGGFNAEYLQAQVMKNPLLTVKTYHYIHKKHSDIAEKLSVAINQAFLSKQYINN